MTTDQSLLPVAHLGRAMNHGGLWTPQSRPDCSRPGPAPRSLGGPKYAKFSGTICINAFIESAIPRSLGVPQDPGCLPPRARLGVRKRTEVAHLFSWFFL